MKTIDPNTFGVTFADSANCDAASETLALSMARLRAELAQVKVPAHALDRMLFATEQAMAARRRLESSTAAPESWLSDLRGRLSRVFATQPPGWSMGLASMAGAVALIVWLGQPSRQAELATQPSRGQDPAAYFMPLDTAGAAIVAVDDTATWLMPLEMPRAQLARFGLPFDPSQAATPVRAEFLMNASGKPVAVRFLP